MRRVIQDIEVTRDRRLDFDITTDPVYSAPLIALIIRILPWLPIVANAACVAHPCYGYR